MATRPSSGAEDCHEAVQEQVPDSALAEKIEQAILRNAKGLERFRREMGILLRKAIDEVIDSPRTKRFTLDELEKTEKTYLGTKVEILLRNLLRFPKGSTRELRRNP